MSQVSLIKCDNYNPNDIYNAIKKGIDLIGGISFVKGKKVLLKPNLLKAAKPEQAITTHPELLRAVIKIVKENGGEVLVGDSPGIGTQDSIYKNTYIDDIIKQEKVEIANFREKKEYKNSKGKICKSFPLAKAFEEVDYIFSLPKLKTHGMTKYTGAIKNLYGMISGLEKPKYHYKYSNHETFAEMIVDLFDLIKPKLSIMDGILALEGNGPSSGDPRQMNFIGVSYDTVALDSVCCNLINIDPKSVYYIDFASKRGLGKIDLNEIDILGSPVDDIKVNNFKLITHEHDVLNVLPVPEFIKKILKYFMVPKPYFIHKDCVLCNECVKVCPTEPKSLKIKNKKVNINRKNCIRCFCCQEMCPYKAIKLKKMVLGKRDEFVEN